MRGAEGKVEKFVRSGKYVTSNVIKISWKRDLGKYGNY